MTTSHEGPDRKLEVRLETTFCAFRDCGKAFSPKSNRQRFCSARCRRRQLYLPTKRKTQARRDASLARRNAEFKIRTRDFSLGFDGRHGGNRNTASTTPIYSQSQLGQVPETQIKTQGARP